MSGFSIGQVARQAAVGVETIRFYERKGLIKEPPRRASGYRSILLRRSEAASLNKRARELGSSETADLLSLRTVPYSSCKNVKRRAAAKLPTSNASFETDSYKKILDSIRRYRL